MTAQSIIHLFNDPSARHRDAAFIAMERHDGCRQGGKGYPCRAIRTENYLYIHNFEPSRWPSGSRIRRYARERFRSEKLTHHRQKPS